MSKQPVYPDVPYELAAALVARLTRRSAHIAFAESCTGGLLAAALVAVPDASRVMDLSVVSYANSAKERMLGVLPETLAAHGAVSREVAAEMASGVAKLSGAEVGVGVTGIAGPGGGSAEKPVGTVCFGFSVFGRTDVRECRFGELSRGEVRAAAVRFAIEQLLTLLSEE